MKCKSLLYAIPLLVLSVGFAGVAVRFKEKRQRVQATHDLAVLPYEHLEGEIYEKRISELLRAGAAPDARMNGRLILVGADSIMTRHLVDAGADVDAHDKDGNAALLEASRFYSEDYTERARILLKHGANPNVRNKNGETALLAASQSGTEGGWCNLEIGRMLLARGAEVDVCDDFGNTPLNRVVGMIVVEKDSIPFAKLLLAYGTNPQRCNKKGETPLMLMQQELSKDPDYEDINRAIRRDIALFQNAVQQRKRVKSPRT